MTAGATGTTARVVVGLSTSSTAVDAATWAARYAGRRGSGLTIAHTPRRAASAHDLAALLRTGSPTLDVSTLTVPGSFAHGLAAESRAADLVVLGPATGTEQTALARDLVARAGCPVVAVPPGTTSEPDLPVVVGTDGGRLAEATVLAGFALATTLDTDVRVVCCTLDEPRTGPRSSSVAQDTFAVTHRCAERYPDLPVDLRIARSHPVTGLIRHARLASVLVIGSDPTGDDSTSHRVLDRSPRPVALVGPLVAARHSSVPLGCGPAVESD